MKPINILKEIDSNNKQRFIDYCKDKIENLGSVTIKGSDVSHISFYDSVDDNKEYNIRVDYISSDGTKALNAGDTVDYFGTENTYLLPNGNVIDGGDMDAGQLNHIAELDFKSIDKQLYDDLLDNWESYDMDCRFDEEDKDETN